VTVWSDHPLANVATSVRDGIQGSKCDHVGIVAVGILRRDLDLEKPALIELRRPLFKLDLGARYVESGLASISSAHEKIRLTVLTFSDNQLAG